MRYLVTILGTPFFFVSTGKNSSQDSKRASKTTPITGMRPRVRTLAATVRSRPGNAAGEEALSRSRTVRSNGHATFPPYSRCFRHPGSETTGHPFGDVLGCRALDTDTIYTALVGGYDVRAGWKDGLRRGQTKG